MDIPSFTVIRVAFITSTLVIIIYIDTLKVDITVEWNIRIRLD